MSAGPGGDREVQHLDGEDEGRDEPGERSRPLSPVAFGTGGAPKLAAGPAQADGDGAGGDDTGDGRYGGVDESVRYMHVGMMGAPAKGLQERMGHIMAAPFPA
ncbi:hypothetical protein GCM10010497_47100 [Streptomyces cinereoruber]|uniref:Uncharacterized protein n=1 Tax=Streptomyces cinereoruber TaxID=67260 RepID=A0AAV4KPV2_9ACTN|nr:hypothetical protein GCM10010497_47100 [Streptomyces cinereoruber]